MPVKPSRIAAQHSLLPTEPPNSERASRPPQWNSVDRQNNVLIHRMADWLDSMYFRKKRDCAISRLPA